MPRKKDGSFAGLYSDIPAVPGGRIALEAAAEETRERLMASTRPDIGGAPINIMLTPQNYQQRVMRVWDAYSSDPLFHRLINRVVEFAANGAQWEVPAESTNDVSWLTKLKRWVTLRESKVEKEEEFWNAWAGQINLGVPNVLPGLNEVVRWCVKHVLLSGMFVPHWQIGEMKLGKQTYIVPTLMTCYPASAITLRRTSGLFMDEDVLYLRPVNQSTTMMEGQFIEAPTFLPRQQGTPANMIDLPRMSRDSKIGASESFVLKHNWSPGDIVGIRRGQIQTTGAGIYPLPPFYSLLPQFVIRQKLFASDASILDGVINFIMHYRIGDKDHPPKPPQLRPDGTILQDGTIAQVRKLIQDGRIGPAMELFTPYYVDLVIHMPKTETLLSDTKYGASATEIMGAFGIFFSRTTSGSRERMEKLNISGFEEFVHAIRGEVRAFFQLLAMHIMELNPGKLTVLPSWSPNPMNTKSEAFMQELYKLKQIGAISTRTLLRHHGLDDDVEIRRIAQELALDVDDLTNENVPLSYVQQAIQPDTGGTQPTNGVEPAQGPKKPKKVKTTAIPPTKQTGRPPK